MTVPDHRQASIKLMCFELLPYALVRAEHMSKTTFLKGMKNRNSGDFNSGSDAWASFLGTPTSQGLVSVDELETLRVVPGDIIVMYGESGAANHTVTVSADSPAVLSPKGPLVYSLADRSPTDYLTELTLAAIIDHFKAAPTQHVRVFTLKQALLS
jgi:hypothetical protein